MSETKDGTPEEPSQAALAVEPAPGPVDCDAAGSGDQEIYRVLARKYRPGHFGDLIGQDAMIRTLSNAFASGRIAHAFMLTGVRGVGKTTTARILARALNYEKEGQDGPGMDLLQPGIHCTAIMESRHHDVIEMDAASRTGIDDIREIIESVRYLPLTARYKVYIIDEVHMLSKAAFNGLLKTLEEPPAHVKFIFATTEIRKVPVTVLSRCQRFDLRRLNTGELIHLLERVGGKEKIGIEKEALSLLARAAEGSARDALSLLDQAIAHSGGLVRVTQVRDMLGLADRGRIVDLMDMCMKGAVGDALTEIRDQYDAGADPAVILSDMAELTHTLTWLKFVPSVADEWTTVEAGRNRIHVMAQALPVRVLARTWQMLLKGISEVQQSSKPVSAAEMVLVRLAHAAGLPAPEDLVAQLQQAGASVSRTPAIPVSAPSSSAEISGAAEIPREGGGTVRSGGVTHYSAEKNGAGQAVYSAGASVAGVSAVPLSSGNPGQKQFAGLRCFEDALALAREKQDIHLQGVLESGIRLVRFEPGTIEIREGSSTQDALGILEKRLSHWTGRRWKVFFSAPPALSSVPDVSEPSRTEMLAAAEGNHPLVKAALESFPDAHIVGVRSSPKADGVTQTPVACAPDKIPAPVTGNNGIYPNEKFHGNNEAGRKIAK